MMVIDLDVIEQAKTEPSVLYKVYRQVFYDGNKPKLRMWLINSGIPYDSLGDLETEMKVCFMLGLNKYQHTKINFEKWIWTEFKYTLMNYFQSKKLLKNSNHTIFTDMVVNSNEDSQFDVESEQGESELTQDDLEYYFLQMKCKQATICRLIYYNGWDKFNIMSQLNMTSQEYDDNMVEIRKIMKVYLSQ